MAVRRIAHFGFRPGRRNAEGTVISREIPKSRRSDLGRDAARHVATNAPALNMPCGTASQGRGDSIGCAYIWWIGGRGNLRENRPYSRHCGDTIAADRAFGVARRGTPRRYERIRLATSSMRIPNPYGDPTVFITPRWLGRALAGGRANSRPAPTAPPLPSAQ